MPRIHLRDWTAPAALLGACLLAFGLTIPWLGLYADDWPFVYVNHLAGWRGVVDFISWVRPVAAWFFASTAALVGTQIWLYHLLLLLLRWLDSVLLWQLLRRAWPGHALPALWTALLFAVYPAFKQQPLALEYTPHFIALAILFGSLWLSLRLVQEPFFPRRQAQFLYGLAWLGSFQVFIIEYFAGLELLRPVLTWMVLSRCIGRRKAAVRATRLWLPYLPVYVAFLLWRVLVVGFPSYQPTLTSDLVSAPLHALRNLAGSIGHDLLTAGFVAWIQPFTLFPPGGRTLLVWAALVIFTLLASGGFLILFARSQGYGYRELPAIPCNETQERSGLTIPVAMPASPRALPLEYAAMGIFAMLAAGWPFWGTGIPLSLDFPWDRTSLAFMFGACLLASGLLGLLGSFRWRFYFPSLVLATLLAFSTGLHFQNANAFRKEWAVLRSFYWQLSWRIPALAPGSAMVLDQTPFEFHVDKFLSPLVNWTYAPGSRSLQTPYSLMDFYKMWGKTLPPETKADPIQTQYGTLHFSGDTGRLLIIVYNPPACLRVLTPPDETHLVISAELKQSLALTNLALIDTAPRYPARPPKFLGPEPAHTWCYYFEKAELALQSGSAAGAAQLGDQVIAEHLSAGQPSEYLVFVRAYAKAGRWEDARALTRKVLDGGSFYKQAACAAWEQIGFYTRQDEAQKTRADIGCP